MPSFSIGNCTVELPDHVQYVRNREMVSFDVPGHGCIRVSVNKKQKFVLLSPKANDCQQLVQEVLQLYAKELPAMCYAADTGKSSSFLERCVKNRKYCTLLCKDDNQVVAAITYQIVSVNMSCAEIPLAAVEGSQQRRGLGTYLYLELRKRLFNVGVSTMYCWADEETEAFWSKLGFTKLADVDGKGRPQKLPLKPELRKAFSIPGSATLMVSSLTDLKDSPAVEAAEEFKSTPPRSGASTLLKETSPLLMTTTPNVEDVKSMENDPRSDVHKRRETFAPVNLSNAFFKKTPCADGTPTATKRQKVGVARCTKVEASSSEFGSVSCADADAVEAVEVSSPAILFMNMANNEQRAQLTKFVESLGGRVTNEGSECTHVLTGQIRRTMNFCAAVCAGAWILSPDWLRASVEARTFVEPSSFILNDAEFQAKYNVDVATVVRRSHSRRLFQGFRVYFTPHVEPPRSLLSRLVTGAGGEVVSTVEELIRAPETATSLVIACKEDVREAVSSSKAGIRTYDTDWLLCSVVKQELDFTRPPFL